MSTHEMTETERAVLALALHDPMMVDRSLALGVLPEHFATRGHQALWSGMVLDRSAGFGPDETTLLDRHERSVGSGMPFATLADLSDSIRALRTSRPKAKHLEGYVQRLSEQRARVHLLEMATLVSSLIDENGETGEAMQEAEKGLLAAAQSRRTGFSFARLGELVGETWDHHDAVLRGEIEDTAIRTGIGPIDRILKLKPKHYSVWAARPSMGKTQAAFSALRNAAGRGTPSLLISIEMDRESLAQRIVDAESMTADRDREEAIRWWDRIPLYIDDTSTTLDEVCSSIRLHVLKHGVKLVAVDYIQIVQMPYNPSRERQIAEASRRFQALAKETGIALVLLAQINRGVEARPDKRPLMSDLRESGALEQDADSVVMLFRPLYYDSAAIAPHELEAIVRKQRNGRTGTAFCHYEIGKWVQSPPGDWR